MKTTSIVPQFEHDMQEAVNAPVPAEASAGHALLDEMDRRYYRAGREDAKSGQRMKDSRTWHHMYRRGYTDATRNINAVIINGRLDQPARLYRGAQCTS